MSVRVDDSTPGIRLVLLDRPDTRNAIDADLLNGLGGAIESASDGVIVIGSTATEAFSSGADLTLTDEERAAVSDGLYALYERMQSAPQLIIAAAAGHAVGGGAQLLLASDIRVAAPNVAIRFAGAGHGLVVGAWGLADLVGRSRAIDLCVSMRKVDAEEAYSIGLVDRISGAPVDTAIAYATHALSLDARALRGLKSVVAAGSRSDRLERERRLNSSWDGSVPPLP